MFGNDLERLLESLFMDNDNLFEVKILRKGFRPDSYSSCCVYNYAGYND